MSNSNLKLAIQFALGLSTGALAFGAPNVFAQDADEQDADDDMMIEEVIITGSRIKRADIDSASPVTVITRAEMEITGLTDVGDLLQSMPSMSGSPIGTTTNNGGNGAVLIDLRGMGTARTLTLVNGKRVVDGGDYQAIPSTMIERVEILKDGASAIYGADAVAGVVNIITRRDFTGIELTAQTADWEDTDGASQDSFSLIAGREFDSGNFVFGAEYVSQEGVFQRDVPWDFLQNSYYIYPNGCETPQSNIAAPYDGTPQGGCYPVGSSRIPESRISWYSQGLMLIGTPASQDYDVGILEAHDGRTYNYAPVNYLQTPYERTNIFGEAHFDLTDNIRFNAEFRGNFRESAQQLAPLPYTGGDPFHNGFYLDPATGETVAYEGISEQNYYLRRAVDAYNDATGGSLIYEPVVQPRRRMIETNRRFEQGITQYQWTAGFEGTFRDMDWDLYINEGHRSRTDRDFGQFSGVRLHNALGPSADLDGDGRPECYTDVSNPATLIVGCVPLNMFGGGVVDAGGTPTFTSLTDDMVDYVSLDTVDTYITRQRTAGTSLAGSNFDLPGGELGWAVGWSYWKQGFTYTPDSAKTIGAVTGNVGAGTDGTLTNNAFYAEFLAPLYDNGTQNFYLKGGLRYDDWDAFSGDTTYQVGLEFQAIDSVKLRGTYGTVFRAPTIFDLFGGQVDSFPTYTDPCVTTPLPPGCAQVGIQTDSQVLARVGGNPNLEPETGDTLTVGVVWTPNFGDHGLSITVDYWEINLDDGISSLGVQFSLDECYRNLNQAACALITRNADYSINNIIDAQLNVSSQGAEGIDTEIRWDYTTDVGQLQASLLWSHLLGRTIQQFDANPVEDLEGRYDGARGNAYAEDKANFSFQWFWNDISVSYLGEYISGLTGDVWFDPVYQQKIPSQYYSDIVASYSLNAFGSTTTISGGITNVTDEEPPFLDQGFNGKTDPSTYRLFGRGWYLRLKWAF